MYRWEGDEWLPDARIGPHKGRSDFGFAWSNVHITNSMLFVGQVDHVDIYRRLVSGWKLEGRAGLPDDSPPGPPASPGAGRMDSDGLTLVIGHPQSNDLDLDLASVHERQGQDWLLIAVLPNRNPIEDDDFGWSVAVEGDTVFVGNPVYNAYNPRPGVVYVYRRGPEWLEPQADPEAQPQVGILRPLWLQRTVAGRRADHSNSAGKGRRRQSGAIYLYERGGKNKQGKFKKIRKLVVDDPEL